MASLPSWLHNSVARGNHRVGDLARCLRVVGKLHAVGGAVLRQRAQRGRVAEQHRLDLVAQRALAQPDDDLIVLQIAALQLGLQQLCRDRRIAEGHALRRLVPVDRLHFQQIDHAAKVLFRANGDGERHRVGAEAILHHLHHAEEICALAVHFVHERQARHMVFIRLPPHRFRLRLHAAEVMVMPRSCSCAIQSVVAAPSCTSPSLCSSQYKTECARSWWSCRHRYARRCRCCGKA